MLYIKGIPGVYLLFVGGRHIQGLLKTFNLFVGVYSYA